jgi:hypothetical protein
MKIGEDDLAGAEESDFRRLRLLDLDDHLGFGDASCAWGRWRADGAVIVVGEPAGHAGLGLDEDLMPGLDQRFGADGHQGDAVFVGFNFLGNSDAHVRRVYGRQWAV